MINFATESKKMKIQLLTIGRTQASYLEKGIQIYSDRLTHYVPFEIVALPDIKNSRGLSQSQQKEKEADLFLNHFTSSDRVVLLDERGKEPTSREFATLLEREMASGVKRLIFVVGGPYGFSERIYQRADMKISFSRMTFSHEMIRLFFTEQVYRAMTILRGEPYHHD